jgi:hypothetical protein
VYYDSADPIFGDKVRDAFQSAQWDIREFGKCYATGRDTAAVFHLMRVVELALHAFAAFLGVAFQTPVELLNWGPVIDKVNKTIATLGNQPNSLNRSQELTFYASVGMQFNYIKDAWRNHVAHGRERYDEGQALSIMIHVREFIQGLAEHGIHE